MSDLQTCRLCGDSNYERAGHKYGLVRYSTRSSVHYDCGLKRWGVDFFAKLHTDQLESFPAFAADDAGLLKALTQEIAQRRSIGHPLKASTPDIVSALEPR